MRARGRAAAAALALGLLAACDGDDGEGCGLVDPYVGPSVMVAPVDSVTGAPVANGAGGWVFATGFADSLRVAPPSPNPSAQLVATVPPGTYSLVVRRFGYLDWAVSGVRVRPGRCGGVQPVSLQAKLQPDFRDAAQPGR